VTNVGSLTFTDGTTLATAAAGGTVNTNAFTGTVTNLSLPTVAYSTNTFIQVSGSGLAPVNDNTYATNAHSAQLMAIPSMSTQAKPNKSSFGKLPLSACKLAKAVGLSPPTALTKMEIHQFIFLRKALPRHQTWPPTGFRFWPTAVEISIQTR